MASDKKRQNKRGEESCEDLLKNVTVTSSVKDLKKSIAEDIFDIKKHVYGMNENFKAEREVQDPLVETQI